ncbi:hypothetical protein EU545_04945 [Candidatus Thorarchaeota archaeon]|nr:MAG: hypothetical protein EU545_04945 [Candidatus Thorarchaeota archaeon]
MKRKVLLALVLGMALMMLAPSVEAFDFDPGPGGSTPEYTLTIQVTGIRLANDGDIFGKGEVYMKNPGTQYWTVSSAKSWAGGTYYSGGSYYGTYYNVPYTVKYQQVITEDDIGTKFWFELMDDDSLWDATLWSGWVKLKAVQDCSISVWTHCNGDNNNYNAVQIYGLCGKYTVVGSSIYVWNQLRISVTITH